MHEDPQPFGAVDSARGPETDQDVGNDGEAVGGWRKGDLSENQQRI